MLYSLLTALAEAGPSSIAFSILVTFALGIVAIAAGIPYSVLNRRVERTVADEEWWCDFAAGNDANDGRTLLTAKKTLSATLAFITPRVIRHKVCVHIIGTHTSGFGGDYNFTMQGGAVLLLGELATTVVADDGGAPWAADINSVSSIGKAGVGWVANAYRGYWVEVLSGPAIGQTRTIQTHTTDTITPTKNFTINPGAGAQFKIVKPKTTFDGGALASYGLNIAVDGVPSGAYASTIYIENVHFTTTGANAAYLVVVGPAHCVAILTGIMFSQGSWGEADLLGYKFNGTLHDAVGATVPLISVGCSDVHGSGYGWYCYNAFAMEGKCLVLDYYRVYDACRLYVDSGSYIRNCASYGGSPSLDISSSFAYITNTAGYATTKFGGLAEFGIEMIDTVLTMGGGVDVSGCVGLAGISCKRSKLRMLGVVTGTGNGGAGVHASQGSQVLIKHGSPPTLTGVVGNLAVENPAVQQETWANIDAGVVVSIAAEMTLVKEV